MASSSDSRASSDIGKPGTGNVSPVSVVAEPTPANVVPEKSSANVSAKTAPKTSDAAEKGAPPAKQYTAFTPWHRRHILIVVTIAGLFGPLAGGIYLPALPVLEDEFHASATAINVTVSVFMLTFAFAVRSLIYLSSFDI